jgi:hypothetical protein
MRLYELESSTFTLWHGGKDLQYNYREFQPSGKGRWEYGPGIYLTTHYDTARKYSSGGKTTYKVVIKKGTDISKVNIPLDTAIDFVKRYAIKKFQKSIIEDLRGIAEKRNGSVYIVAVSNLLFNSNAISSANTVALRKFLVDNGVDYEIVTHFGGRDETVVVIYNPKIILSVTAVKAKDVQSSEWEQPTNLS